MKKSLRIVGGLVAVLLLLVVVYVLMGGKIREKFSNDQPKVTYFFLPECGWCKKFMPEWEKFEALAEKEGVKATKVNAQEKADVVTKKGITSFPTVIVEKSGKESEYSGERTAEDLLKFVKSA